MNAYGIGKMYICGSFFKGEQCGSASKQFLSVLNCNKISLCEQDCNSVFIFSPFKPTQVKSLRLKLQKLQDKAIEEDDYDKGEFCLVYSFFSSHNVQFRFPSLFTCILHTANELCNLFPDHLHSVTVDYFIALLFSEFQSSLGGIILWVISITLLIFQKHSEQLHNKRYIKSSSTYLRCDVVVVQLLSCV